MIEYNVFSKDYIKLNFLNEVTALKSVRLDMYFECDHVEKDFLSVRPAGRNVYRFNNFNISEDNTSNCITFRPILIDGYTYFKINSDQNLKISIIKNGTSFVVQEFDILAGETRIELYPQGTNNYIMKINQISTAANVPSHSEKIQQNVNQEYDQGENIADRSFDVFGSDYSFGREMRPINNAQDMWHTDQAEMRTEASRNDISYPERYSSDIPQSERNRRISEAEHSNERLQNEISAVNDRIIELEEKNRRLTDNKMKLISHMDSLMAEYNKNYSSYLADVNEIKEQYNIDEEILRIYSDTEISPIEDLIENARNSIEKMEDQIRNFVEAQARKTASIENELKIGKKD